MCYAYQIIVFRRGYLFCAHFSVRRAEGWSFFSVNDTTKLWVLLMHPAFQDVVRTQNFGVDIPMEITIAYCKLDVIVLQSAAGKVLVALVLFDFKDGVHVTLSTLNRRRRTICQTTDVSNAYAVSFCSGCLTECWTCLLV
ncbi:hypothetical protein T265_02523 [Opisthorchis viverrini]|uniref:Uncharacterized protein n=1 Tax=Opisthorchis viverrini TaxID=6198 RepID=A0A074ZZ04_OPIVI|nr:hypothetical protein T265_02523 [Opisthorchis viverrini]KER31202.1 hypothetical protein T265_02523 [Opisthorchis viverrini]